MKWHINKQFLLPFDIQVVLVSWGHGKQGEIFVDFGPVKAVNLDKAREK